MDMETRLASLHQNHSHILHAKGSIMKPKLHRRIPEYTDNTFISDIETVFGHLDHKAKARHDFHSERSFLYGSRAVAKVTSKRQTN